MRYEHSPWSEWKNLKLRRTTVEPPKPGKLALGSHRLPLCACGAGRGLNRDFKAYRRDENKGIGIYPDAFILV